MRSLDVFIDVVENLDKVVEIVPSDGGVRCLAKGSDRWTRLRPDRVTISASERVQKENRHEQGESRCRVCSWCTAGDS